MQNFGKMLALAMKLALISFISKPHVSCAIVAETIEKSTCSYSYQTVTKDLCGCPGNAKLTKDEKVCNRAIWKATNCIRQCNKLPLLNLNTTLSLYGQCRADVLASECSNIAHCNTNPNGENLFATAPAVTVDQITETFVAAAQAWYQNECLTYNQVPTSLNHVTQLLWSGSTEQGCGISSCSRTDELSGQVQTSTFVACDYYPAGNVIGESQQNLPFPMKCDCSLSC